MSILGRAKVITEKTVGDQLSAAHLSGVSTLNVTDAREFAPGPGQVYVNGDIYSYTTADTTANTIALSAPTTAGYSADERVSLYPLVPFKIAMVQIENEGASIPVFVPHEWMALMAEGLYDPGIEVEIAAEPTREYSYRVASVIGRAPLFDASCTPVVTATDGGERVQIDGNGITLYTNDPVQQLAFTTIGSPFGVAIDSAGNTYVGDFTNRFLRKFTPTGAQVVSGNFPIPTTGIPTAVALDSSGNIYVTDQSGPLVRKFSSAGVAGITFSVPASPTGIAVDAGGNIYVSEQSGNNVRKYNSSGTQIVTGGFPISTTGAPKDVTLDAAGNIYVPDVTNNLIRKFSSAGVAGLTFAAAQPVAVRLDSAGYFYVADLNSVTRYTPAGAVDPNQPFPWGDGGRAGDLAIDTAGNIYVTDQTNYLIRKYNNPGVVIASGQLISALGRFLAFNATIAGNLEVDSISSANGLQITSPVTALLKMQAKTGVTVASGTGTTTVAVTYDAPFLVAPAVAFTANDAKLTNPIKTVSSTTGFTVQWARSATGTYTFDWIAVVQ